MSESAGPDSGAPNSPGRPTSRGHNSLVTIEASWEGPLPSPDTLRQFNEIVPDSAERIFREWEDEARHRRQYENRSLRLRAIERIGGRLLAFVLALAMIGLAAYCASNDQSWVAAVIGGGTISTVVIAMISGRRD